MLLSRYRSPSHRLYLRGRDGNGVPAAYHTQIPCRDSGFVLAQVAVPTAFHGKRRPAGRPLSQGAASSRQNRRRGPTFARWRLDLLPSNHFRGSTKQGEAALARIAQAAQPNGTPQLGEVHPVRRPFLPANQNYTPALSPLRRQNPREEPGALAAHAGICAGGRGEILVPTATVRPDLLLRTVPCGFLNERLSR